MFITITAAEVREGDIILSPLHGNRRYEVGSIEVRTERLRHRYNEPVRRFVCDERIFTWRPVGAAKFHQGLCFDATETVEVVR